MKKEARMAMANAGFLAGASFSNSMVGVIHAIAHVIRLQKKLHRMTGLPITLKEAGADPALFPEVAKTALNDGAVIVNPRQVTYEAVIRILEVSYGD